MSERDKLVREVLNAAVVRWSATTKNRGVHFQVLHPAGNTSSLFKASQQGLSTIVYSYILEPAIESIIASCEQQFEASEECRNWSVLERNEAIKTLARECTERLLAQLPERLSEAVQLTIEESLLLPKVILEGFPAHRAGGIVDVREAINELVNTAAGKMRKRLSAELKRLGHSEILTPEDDLRRPKITIGRLELAYKKVKKQKEEGEKVLRKDVADKLKVDADYLGRWCKQELRLAKWAKVVEYLKTT